jgi:hypothetical protein
MLEVNVIVNTFDKSSSVPDGLLYDWYNDLVNKDLKDKSSMVKNIVVSGYVQMMLLIAKDYKKEIKIHQITEVFLPKNDVNCFASHSVIINRNDNGQYEIGSIKSLNVLENILWEML